jgi:hypothetical protein
MTIESYRNRKLSHEIGSDDISPLFSVVYLHYPNCERCAKVVAFDLTLI